MVVGTGAYQDRNEAYPLDKKTLRTIALRSLFSGSSFNGETAHSIGWLWAIEPGLRKIHTNETDLALSMGHNLEYVNGGGFFSSLAMGITLALEQQKADLETIRSVRTAAAAAARAPRRRAAWRAARPRECYSGRSPPPTRRRRRRRRRFS